MSPFALVCFLILMGITTAVMIRRGVEERDEEMCVVSYDSVWGSENLSPRKLHEA